MSVSCPIDIILTEDTQKTIDTGIRVLSEKISNRIKPEKKDNSSSNNYFDNCKSNTRNKAVLWANIGIQFLLLIFLGVIAVTKGEQKWAFDILGLISWVTLVLTGIQYQDGIMAGAKIFIFGTGVKPQSIVAISLAIVLLTNLLKSRDGGVASIVAAVIIMFIIGRTVMQIQSAFSTVSPVPVVLDFVNRVITVDRVKKLKNALR
jgi:hypothetical protein